MVQEKTTLSGNRVLQLFLQFFIRTKMNMATWPHVYDTANFGLKDELFSS